MMATPRNGLRQALHGSGPISIVAVSTAFALSSCGNGAVLQGRIQGLQKIAEEAEQNGATRCAPRELAIAKAQLDFARAELAQGFLSKAGAHVALAEPNARAAYTLSPPEHCAIGDRDGDGYPDVADRCPEHPESWNGHRDEDGCPDDPDTDEDGVPDSRDMCMVDPEDRDDFLDGDGCPDVDNDLDGIADRTDKCPNAPEDPDGFDDTDGCPDTDNDKDSILDVDDHCPNEPGAPGGEHPGCPGLVVVTDKEIKITQQIHFEFDRDVIRRESYPILDAVVEVLKNNPGMQIEVQGHTDSKGAAQYNLRLSDRRASAVRKYLVSHGIQSDRLVSRGYGMTRPIVPNDTDQNRALNRRVQFIRIEGGNGSVPRD